jgi:hypothetical protein
MNVPKIVPKTLPHVDKYLASPAVYTVTLITPKYLSVRKSRLRVTKARLLEIETNKIVYS